MSIKHELLLSDQAIDQHEMVKKLSNSNGASAEAITFMVGMRKARELYEQARAKDAELIQIAVDMAHERVIGVSEKMRELVYKKETLLLAMASAAGFKPTEQ